MLLKNLKTGHVDDYGFWLQLIKEVHTPSDVFARTHFNAENYLNALIKSGEFEVMQ